MTRFIERYTGEVVWSGFKHNRLKAINRLKKRLREYPEQIGGNLYVMDQLSPCKNDDTDEDIYIRKY